MGRLAPIVVGLLVFLSSPGQSQQQCQTDLSTLLDQADSDAKMKYTAADTMSSMLAACDPEQRKDAVSWLLASLPDLGPNKQRVILGALSSPNPPWESSNQERSIRGLYGVVRVSPNTPFGSAYDNLLANAKGLYFDAIAAYNQGDVSNVDEVVAKLNKMSHLTRSRFSGNAAFYTGSYLAKVAQITKNFADYIPRSDQAYDAYVSRAAANEFPNADFKPDAYYYKALNAILLGNDQEATKRLDAIPQEALTGRKIYVWKLFHSTDPLDVAVDTYFPAQTLVTETRAFIAAKPGALPAKQRELIAKVQAQTQSAE